MVSGGLGWAADAMEVLLISFALPAIGQEWGLTNPQKGLLGTAIFLGMLAGAWVGGRLSDVIGRKTGFVSVVGIYPVNGYIWYTQFTHTLPTARELTPPDDHPADDTLYGPALSIFIPFPQRF